MPRSRLLALVLALPLAGCPTNQPELDGGGPGPDSEIGPDTGGSDANIPSDVPPLVAPIFRSGVTMADRELAMEALRLMGSPEAGGAESCHTCHGITRDSIAHFRTLSDTALDTCFSDLTVATPAAAEAVIACFMDGPRFSASNLGIFASGAYFPWFRYVFERSGRPTWEADYAAFTRRIGMPPEGHTPFTQAEFNLVTEWFIRGTPFVNDILPGIDPGVCEPSIGPEMAAIVANGAASGWTARNEAAGILMHGCASATTPLDCLATYPLAADRPIGIGWATAPGTHARILFETDYHTSYWTRSSADGRFVAHGGGPAGASIIDLQRDVAIQVSGAYDPGFFPDNSGFMFQGTPVGDGVCETSVLTTGTPTRINFSEAGCAGGFGISLYQHVGTSLDGGDYWVVNGAWSGDPGGNGSDPTLFVDGGSTSTFISLRNSGTVFTLGDTHSVSTPMEGSSIISPSATLLVNQIGGIANEPVGYVVRRVTVTGTGPSRTVTAPEVARYCFPGGKPAISLDDRWMVTHHRADDSDAVDLGFTGPSDPGFAAYRGISNLYLIDLLTGVRTRITRMAPGQEALFPHFRSDGWIYFIVRTGSLPEYVVASDAALVLSAD